MRARPRSQTCADCGITCAAHISTTRSGAPRGGPTRLPAWWHRSRRRAAHFQRAMMMDVDQSAKAMRDEETLAEIEDFLEGFNQPTYRRHADQRSAGRYLVLPARMVRR
jgi:hypothetical protein